MIWVGRFTHLSKWGNAARKSPDEVIQQMENRRASSFSSPTTDTQNFDFLRSETVQLSTHHHLRNLYPRIT